jgi:hypothetical protein
MVNLRWEPNWLTWLRLLLTLTIAQFFQMSRDYFNGHAEILALKPADLAVI